jgi:hypothetical protein
MYNMEYPIMNFKETALWLPIIENFEVSKQARSKNGFLTNYLEKGSDMLNQVSDENKITWNEKRKRFIKRTLPAFIKKPSIRRFISLIAWAYEANIYDPDLYKDIFRLRQLISKPMPPV